MKAIYTTPTMPYHYIARDGLDGHLYFFGTERGAWERRRQYNGQAQLTLLAPQTARLICQHVRGEFDLLDMLTRSYIAEVE